MTETVTVNSRNVHEWLFESGLTDGLPVVPPTRERVNAMLQAAPGAANDVLGAVKGRGVVVNVEQAAVNAVMAGCRPDFFKVVLTALSAALDPAFGVNAVCTSTGGAGICVIVSGPITEALGMNSRHNVLGSGNRANATIGRAVRLTLTNALEAKPGKLDASSIGHPGKYSLCFAENEPENPWPPLRVEHGFGVAESTVTVVATEGPRQIANHLQPSADGILMSIASAIRSPSTFIAGKGGQCVVVLGYEHELAIRGAGMTKPQIAEFLAHHSRISPAELEAAGVVVEVGGQHKMIPGDDGNLGTVASEDIFVVTAGGPGAGWSALLPAWAPKIHSRAVTRAVFTDAELPDCGDDSCDISRLSAHP